MQESAQITVGQSAQVSFIAEHGPEGPAALKASTTFGDTGTADLSQGRDLHRNWSSGDRPCSFPIAAGALGVSWAFAVLIAQFGLAALATQT